MKFLQKLGQLTIKFLIFSRAKVKSRSQVIFDTSLFWLSIGALIFSLGLSVQAATLSINGNVKYQTIDGFGVNANSLSWDNGELKPAIDMLADEMGSSLWRVVFDMEDWESVNDDSNPANFNWTYYNSLYSNSKFQNLWGTLGYLNQKGITSGITLSFMGRVPNWMSSSGNGNNIATNYEDEWVEMITSLVYYAKNTAHVSFSMLDPINEPDWNGYEGPQVGSAQYTRLLNKISQKLNSLGLSDIKFLGPNTASIDTGINTYMPQMMNDSAVMLKVDHFGFHNYEGTASNASQAIKSSAYPNHNFYMTEISTPAQIFSIMNQGTSGVHIWDGYDSVYNHAILMGYGTRPPNDAGNAPAPLAYNSTTGIYTPRKEFYLHEQLFKYIPAGSVRIAASQSTMSAFFHQASGRVTLVGANTSSGSITYTGTLTNLPVISSLEYYWTSATDPTKNFFKNANLTVTNGAFSFSAPANSTYTLTGLVNSADRIPPTVSITAPAEGAIISNTTTISATASDSVGVAAVRFLLDGVKLGGEIFSPPYNLPWDITTVTNGNHQIAAVARDIGGNEATSAVKNVFVSNTNIDSIPPTVAITSPTAGATVAGTISIIASASDNVGVAGVQFLLDSAPFKTEITVAPYSSQLDTTSLTEGLHSIAAKARDTSGNTTTSQSISFTVANKSGTYPINLVQKASNITSSAQNLATLLPSSVTAGNLIVVSVSGWPNLPAATPVTDSLGNTYSIAGTVQVSQGAYSAIYYAKNVKAGVDTVTVRTVNSGGQISMAVAEFSGADPLSPLDKAAGTAGSGNTPSSGAMTPGITGELVIGSGTHNGNTVTSPGSGFTMISIPTEDSNTHQPLAMEYQVLGAIQQTTATFSMANAYSWTQNGVLFRPAVQQGPDTTPPVVSITSPSNNATVSSVVTVTANASDNMGVTGVQFYLDDAPLGAPDTSAPYSIAWDSKTTTNNTHTLSARVSDAAGNIGQSSDVTITVFNDTAAPTVSISAPSNNDTVTGTIPVTASAIDNVGVTKVEFYLNTSTLLTTVTTSPYIFNWDTTTLAKGAYTLTAKAYDNAGNIGTSNTVIVTVTNNSVASIALAQKASNTTSSAQNLATRLPSSVTAGNLIVVSVSGWPNLPAATAVTDSLGNTYSIAGTVLLSQGAYSAIYYAKNVKAGTDTVTFRTVKSGGQISMAVAEFSGVNITSPLDKTIGAVGSGNTPASGIMIPSLANELVIGSGTHNGNTTTSAGAGFIMIAIPTEDSNTHQPLAMEYQVLSGVPQTNATFSLNTGYTWTQNGALFKSK